MPHQPVAENDDLYAASDKDRLSESIYPRIRHCVQYRCWRRKMGAATLVMACAVMALWIRSLGFHDEAWYPVTSTKVLGATSEDGCFCIGIASAVDPNLVPKNAGWLPLPRGVQQPGMESLQVSIAKLRRILTIRHVGVFGRSDDSPFQYAYYLVLPYWIAAPLLTLLSNYLLLSKPRPKQKQSVPHA